MKWVSRITPAAVVLFALAACAPADDVDTMDEPAVEPGAVTETMVPAELEARADALVDAFNADDPAAIAAFYAEDAVVHADTLTLNGREAIQNDWLAPTRAERSGLVVEGETWEPMGDEFSASGRYTYTATTPDGELRETGTYEMVWTHGADGQWYVRSMTTTTDPAANTAQ